MRKVCFADFSFCKPIKDEIGVYIIFDRNRLIEFS